MKRVAAQRLVSDDDFTSFGDLYSRYKYGMPRAVRFLGALLGTHAVTYVKASFAPSLTIIAPGSRSTPIGADYLADEVLKVVNRARHERGLQPAVRGKLHRHVVPSGDYGGLSAAERQALLANEKISANPSLITGCEVIVVDDLWVTGASADVTIKAIMTHAPASLTYLLIAEVDESIAHTNASVERDLNHAAIHDLASLATAIHNEVEEVFVMQRLCKFLLGHHPEELESFLRMMSASFVWHLLNACIADGLGLLPLYEESFLSVQRVASVCNAGVPQFALAEGLMP